MPRPTLPPGQKRTKRGIMLNAAELAALDALALAWRCSRNDAVARAVFESATITTHVINKGGTQPENSGASKGTSNER